MTFYCEELFKAVREEFDDRLLFGNRELLDLFLIAFLARGHVLVEGPPGTGKTLSAKLLAHKLSKSFKRIQFTSDLLPGDIIGAHIYSPSEHQFNFIPGPLFSDFVLADEVNRTPPRTQSALLEAMEERQVTVEGKTFKLNPDFFVVATQNPYEMEGTFPLPEAQVDRFLFNVVVGHASPQVEARMLQSILSGTLPPQFERISSLAIDRGRVNGEIQGVTLDQSLLNFVTKILDQTRKHPLLSQGSSIRGGIGLCIGAKVRAISQGRTFVTPDDIKSLCAPVLRHRIKLSPEAQIANASEVSVIEEILKRVEFPS